MAASAGVPQIAAVGCSAAASASAEWFASSPADELAVHLRSQVLEIGQLEQRRLLVDPQVRAERPQRGAHVLDRVTVLVAVLGRRQQRRAERQVRLRRAAARHRPGQDQRVQLAAGAADQQLGSSAEQAVAGERVAVRVASSEPRQQDLRVDVSGGGRVQLEREHDLAQRAVGDGADGRRDRAFPLRRGQAAVGPAQAGRASRAVPASRRRPGRRGRPRRPALIVVSQAVPAPATEHGPAARRAPSRPRSDRR